MKKPLMIQRLVLRKGLHPPPGASPLERGTISQLRAGMTEGQIVTLRHNHGADEFLRQPTAQMVPGAGLFPTPHVFSLIYSL